MRALSAPFPLRGRGGRNPKVGKVSMEPLLTTNSVTAKLNSSVDITFFSFSFDFFQGVGGIRLIGGGVRFLSIYELISICFLLLILTFSEIVV